MNVPRKADAWTRTCPAAEVSQAVCPRKISVTGSHRRKALSATCFAVHCREDSIFDNEVGGDERHHDSYMSLGSKP
jgi:hypothetical protein